MAQVLKLKRTAVQGKVPTTSNLELGELAINTYDGRLFFEKDNGNPSIQEIFTTDADITGSLKLNGNITSSNLLVTGDTNINGNLTLGGTIYIGDNPSDSVIISAEFSGSLIPDGNEYYDLGASNKKWNNIYVKRVNATTVVAESLSGSFSGSYVGDGSGLVNLPNADVSQVATVTSSFSNQSTINVTHNFDTYNVIVSTYDTSYNQLIPQSVSLTDTNTVQVVLSSADSGHIVVAKGGHLVTGLYVDDVTILSDTFTNQTSYTVNHSFNTKDVIVTVYNTNDEQIIPQSVSTPTTSSVQLGFETGTSGRVVVVKAGHVVSGSIPFENISNKPDLISGSVTGSNVVGSNTITSIETMTSASYAAITPVSGTLYIITD